jgi:hypothetical protein
MRKIDKVFNLLFLAVITILVIASFLALIIIHWTFSDSNYSFSLSPSSINTYLSAYGDYKALFTGTIAAIAAYYGLHRMTVAADANIQKIKQDRFSEWKTILDIRFVETDKKDPFMKREFVRVRLDFFERLYTANFNIENIDALKNIFEPVFGNLIQFFEDQNEMMIQMGGVYQNEKYSYSFDSFQFLFLGSVGNVYNEIKSDLLKLYLAKLPDHRFIDAELYKSSLTNYLKRSK